jgi:hypothetical protein
MLTGQNAALTRSLGVSLTPRRYLFVGAEPVGFTISGQTADVRNHYLRVTTTGDGRVLGRRPSPYHDVGGIAGMIVVWGSRLRHAAAS